MGEESGYVPVEQPTVHRHKRDEHTFEDVQVKPSNSSHVRKNLCEARQASKDVRSNNRNIVRESADCELRMQSLQAAQQNGDGDGSRALED